MADEEKRVEEIEDETETEEEDKSSLMEWIANHPKTVFWTRFVLWTMSACILPFSFIVWRFKLFHKITQIQVGGFGIIAIVVVAFFALTIIKYIKLALSAKYTLIGQVLSGFCMVIIPLIAALLILNSVKENVASLIQALGCVTICEAVAIPLNPLPKWAYEAQKNVRVEERKETMDYILDGFFKRKKQAESGGE